jgi:hypothetical protein
LFTNSGEFQVRYSSGENGSCDLRNLTVLSSTAATAFKTQSAYADSVPVGSAKTSNIYFRNDKFNPHGYGMGSQHMTGMALREIDSVVFDFVNQAVGESGDLYIPDSNRAVSLNAARSTPANILSKVNDNL